MRIFKKGWQGSKFESLLVHLGEECLWVGKISLLSIFAKLSPIYCYTLFIRDEINSVYFFSSLDELEISLILVSDGTHSLMWELGFSQVLTQFIVCADSLERVIRSPRIWSEFIAGNENKQVGSVPFLTAKILFSSMNHSLQWLDIVLLSWQHK